MPDPRPEKEALDLILNLLPPANPDGAHVNRISVKVGRTSKLTQGKALDQQSAGQQGFLEISDLEQDNLVTFVMIRIYHNDDDFDDFCSVCSDG